ncbi:MAG: hypothetical protein AB7G44_05650 [Bacteroidia bacterium]
METNENIESKSGILKNVILVIALSAVAGLGYIAYEQYNDKKALEAEVATLGQYNTEALAGFSKIERNLMDIREREGSIINDLNAENEVNAQQRIENEIKAIEGLIKDNKALVNALKLNLGDKDKQIGQFTASISQLEGRIKKYKEEADYLRADLRHQAKRGDSLTVEVAERDFDLGVKAQVISLQADHLTAMTTEIRKREMAKREAFFVVGTFSELKEKNVVDKEGGVLGMGSTKVLKENFARDQFVKIDKLNFELIPVFAKHAEVVSNHDLDSYEYVFGKNDEVEFIKIIDPEKFWENTRYLVVVTKGTTVQS